MLIILDITNLELSQDVLRHVVFSDGVDHEALVANRAVRRPILMALLLKTLSKLFTFTCLFEDKSFNKK